MHIPIDHLVYAARDLERGMHEVERLTGVSPIVGGQHPGRGTRNALIGLGTQMYLEIVAPDPDQRPPAAERWLGVDTVFAPRLTAWAAKATDLVDVQRRSREHDLPLGEVKSGSRQRADGSMLSWQLTEPVPLIADGAIPFLIDWGASPHPAASSPDGGVLLDFRIEHPDVAAVQRMLRVLDLDVQVSWAQSAALVAVIEGRRGRVELR